MLVLSSKTCIDWPLRSCLRTSASAWAQLMEGKTRAGSFISNIHSLAFVSEDEVLCLGPVDQG